MKKHAFGKITSYDCCYSVCGQSGAEYVTQVNKIASHAYQMRTNRRNVVPYNNFVFVSDFFAQVVQKI